LTNETYKNKLKSCKYLLIINLNFKIKKILPFIAIAFLTINLSAQEVKVAAKVKAKKESCCAKKNSKGMTTAEVEKCKAKCKAEGKKCDATTAKKC
jgi:hypothetical protein